MKHSVIMHRVASALLMSAAVVALPASVSAQDWTGLYVGVNVGAGQSDVKWSNLIVPGFPGQSLPGDTIINPSAAGFVGGAQVGFNQQMGPWVWGVEAAFDGSDLDGSSTNCFGGYGGYHATCGTRTSWKLDFTGRIGGTVGPALLYVKGGGELADELTFAKSVRSGGFVAGTYKSKSSMPFGYVFGAGAEVAFTDSISGALEYDYSSVSFTAHMQPAPGAADPIVVIPFNVHVDHQENVVTARLNFKLE